MAEYPNLMKQDFSQSKIGPGETDACVSPATFESNDDCFSPGDIMPEISFRSDIGPQALRLFGEDFVSEGMVAINNPYTSMTGNDGDPFSVLFDEERYSVVGLKIGCIEKVGTVCDRDVFVEVFGFDFQIGSTVINVDSTFTTFLGVSSTEAIREVRIQPADLSEGFTGVSIVYFGRLENVPTMSEWGMMATVAVLGFISFMVLRRRKRSYN